MRILYIDINSLRPDHLGCYGYHRPTSPNIDWLARQGVRFDNCYATDAPCLPSQAAFFSGRHGVSTGIVSHGGGPAAARTAEAGQGLPGPTPADSLTQHLRRAGCLTAMISPFPGKDAASLFGKGFHETIDTGRNGLERAHEVYPFVECWLRAHAKDSDWFLHVNLWDPHTPYDVPLQFGQPFAHSPSPSWLTQAIIDRHRRSYGPHDAVTPCGHTKDFNWPRGAGTIRHPRDWKAWIDGYDTGIRHADHYVGEMIKELGRLGRLDETAIVVSADHGENQGELEVYGDHQTADQHTSHIPLIIRWPGLTDPLAGRSWPGLIYNIDLAATLADLVTGRPADGWDGRSFAALLRGDDCPGREFLVLSQGAWSCQRSLRWKDWLLIRTHHTGNKNLPALMLFDLKSDPHETSNLASIRPDLVGEGLRLMDQWLGQQLARSGATDPLAEIVATGGPCFARDQEVRRLTRVLRATGRPAHADWLEANPGTPRMP
ncbi:MAG: sulfatase [Opitutaceae bacterium]